MKLFRSTLLVSCASLFSRLLGIWRENLLASAFGGIHTTGSNPLDAYYAAFRIPDFLYNLVIMSVGAAIFVPIFTRELKNDHKHINDIVNNFIHVGMIILLVGSLLIYLCIPVFIDTLTLGFTIQNKELTAGLIKIMLLSPLFFGLSSIIGSYLSVYKDFTAYIWSPVIYNLFIIIGILFLVPSFGVYGIAYGVVLGALFHVAIQFIPLLKYHYRYHFICSFSSAAILEVRKLVLPRIIGISASQFNLIVDTVIASTLVSGSLTILNWTQNMQYLPIGLIGISISVTVFTVLADYAVVHNTERFASILMKTIRIIIFLSIPLTVGFVILRENIVDLIFNYGKFSQGGDNLSLTANTLAIFILSLLFQGLIPLLTRAFYSYQDTKTPVVSTIYTVLMNIVLSLLFTKVCNFGVLGLALSFSIANTFNALMLLLLLHKKILRGKWSAPTLVPFLYKTILAAMVMGVTVYIMQQNMYAWGTGKLILLVNLSISGLIGVALFFLCAKLLKIKEMDYLLSKIPFSKRKLDITAS